MSDRTIRMSTLAGTTLPVHCPSWCAQGHEPDDIADDVWHEGPTLRFQGPGDHYYQDGPYEIMTACVSAQPNDATGEYGRPYLAFDTLAAGQAARLNVEQADALIADLRQYTDRLQQMRDHLAQITATKGEQR